MGKLGVAVGNDLMFFCDRILHGDLSTKEQDQAGVIHPKQDQHDRSSAPIYRGGIAAGKVIAQNAFPYKKQDRSYAGAQDGGLIPHFDIGQYFKYRGKQRGDKEKRDEKTQDIGKDYGDRRRKLREVIG